MRTLLLSIVTSFLFVACSAQTAYKNVDATAFKTAIENAPGELLDVRTPREFASGHIENATLTNLRDPETQKRILSLPKDTPLYLYCYSGARSRSVAVFLTKQGFTNVYNLQRGTIEWTQKGYPLVKGAGATPKKNVTKLSQADYQKLIQSNELVFVDFYAPWCPPCKRMLPVMEQLKKEYAGKVKIVKVNFDDNKELVAQLGVKGVPYLVLYKNGKQVFVKDGEMNKAEMKSVFDQNL